MNKPIQKAWTFASGSNPNKTYQALQYIDGSTSCDCMGWCRRVASDGSRTCKHTRSIEMGRADFDALSSKDYNSSTAKTPTVQAKVKTVTAPKKKAVMVPARKVVW